MKKEDKFFTKFVKSENGCWEWNGAKRWNGYGKFSHYKKTILAHRFSYEFYFGPIEEGFFVLHKCDNRGCVNPEHLFIGTQKDNMIDMVSKDRHAKVKIKCSCELNPKSKLKINDIDEIIAKYKNGLSSRKIASEYNVSKTMILNIVNGKNWIHINEFRVSQ